MRSVMSRVERLERRIGDRGPCPECDGRGWAQTEITQPPLATFRSGGCPRCGKVSGTKRIGFEPVVGPDGKLVGVWDLL